MFMKKIGINIIMINFLVVAFKVILKADMIILLIWITYT